MATFTKVASLDEVPEGQGLGLEIGSKRIVLFNIEGELLAVEATQLPEAMATLSMRSEEFLRESRYDRFEASLHLVDFGARLFKTLFDVAQIENHIIRRRLADDSNDLTLFHFE